MLPAILEDEVYDEKLNKYLNEGINYGANTIKNADVFDLQQLAADSFFYGYLFAVERFEIASTHVDLPHQTNKNL